MIKSIGRGVGASTSTGISVSPNPSAQPDDFVVCAHMLRHATATPATPAGWSSAFSDVINTNRLTIFSRICTGYGSDGGGTEPAATFTHTSAPYWVMAWTVRGVDPTDPFLVPVGAGNNATTGTSLTGPSLTAPDSNGLALWWWITYLSASATSGTVTPPSQLDITASQVRTAQSAGYVGSAGAVRAPDIATPTGTRIATATSGSWRSFGLVLREDRRHHGDHHLAA